MLTNAKKRKTVLMMTLNPSLERSLVDIIDASDPNSTDPATAPNTMIGMVTSEISASSKKTG